MSFSKVNFPFTHLDYESFYDKKFAFVASPILQYCWGKDYTDDDIHHHKLICNYLKDQGYYVYTQFFRVRHKDSIFFHKLYKYLEGNMVVVQPNFRDVIVYNYNPIGFIKIPFKESDDVILGELKEILE